MQLRITGQREESSLRDGNRTGKEEEEEVMILHREKERL